MNRDEAVRRAAELDRLVKNYRADGADGYALLAAMADHLPKFRAILDGHSEVDLDRLTTRFPNFGYFGAMLTEIAQGIADGAIPVPDDGEDEERSFGWVAESKFGPKYAGLVKFMLRSDWEDALEGVLDDHFGAAMDEFDLDDAGITDVIGDEWTVALWMAAFEDLAASNLDVGDDGELQVVNMVDDFFFRGRKVPGPVRLYLRALQGSVMSLYEITDVKPGVSLRARDLVRGGDPVLVFERSGTESLKQWDQIGAHILTVAGKNELSAGVLKYNLDGAQRLVDGFREARDKAGVDRALSIPVEELRHLAHLFSAGWLFDVLPKAMGLVTPTIVNSDGDEVVFHRLRFPLASGVLPAPVVARLETDAEFDRESAHRWVWLSPKRRGRASAGRPRNPASGEAMRSDGTMILGHVEVLESAVTVSVSSVERAKSAAKRFGALLADVAGVPLTVMEKIDQARAARERDGQGNEPAAVPDEIAAPLIHDMLDRHYHEVLDQPVGMLGNITPRRAAKTPAGRCKVVEWLKYIENTSANAPLGGRPMAIYDFGWIWRELGVEDLRR